MNDLRAQPLARVITGLGVLCFGYLLVLSSWLSDDAFITFRTVDNFVNGYGLTWNTAERVQAYTNTLWMLLVSLFYAPFGNILLVAYGLSFACALAALAILLKALPDPWAKACAVLLLISSKACIDYTSSGLETPLVYALLALFYALYLGPYSQKAPRATLVLWAVAALAYLTRQDTVLLCLPPLLHVFFRTWKTDKRAALGQALLGLTPAILWTGFSLAYYGFIFPNTYYAKLDLGIDRSLLLEQGLTYARACLVFDPVTLAAIGAAIALGLGLGPLQLRLASLAMATYVGYVIYIGADFMAGRFLSYVFIVACLVLGRTMAKPWALKILAAALACYALVWPYAPLKTSIDYEEKWRWDENGGIADERGVYYLGSSLVRLGKNKGAIDYHWAEKGRALKESATTVVRMDGIGYYGFYAGPHKHIIDIFGLSDALIARLPPTLDHKVEFRPGHLKRKVPAGYEASCPPGDKQKNQIQNPKLKAYYELVKTATTGEFFSLERAKALLALTFSQKKFHYAPRTIDYAASAQPVAFDDNGLILALPALQRADGLSIGLHGASGDAFLVCFRNQGATLACHQLDPLEQAGRQDFQLLTPPSVRAKGFDALHIDTAAGANAYVLEHLQLW